MQQTVSHTAPERQERRGASYTVLLIALLVCSGLFLGFAIPTFIGIVSSPFPY